VQAQLTESTLLMSQLDQITTQVSEQKKRKIRSRKSLQKGGVYSVSQAHSAIAEKERKEQKKRAEKEARAFKKLQVKYIYYGQVIILTYTLYRT
jgi:predicted Ser/Thr protein kinase